MCEFPLSYYYYIYILYISYITFQFRCTWKKLLKSLNQKKKKKIICKFKQISYKNRCCLKCMLFSITGSIITIK